MALMPIDIPRPVAGTWSSRRYSATFDESFALLCFVAHLRDRVDRKKRRCRPIHGKDFDARRGFRAVGLPLVVTALL
jgi:hypothetical protein